MEYIVIKDANKLTSRYRYGTVSIYFLNADEDFCAIFWPEMSRICITIS